MAADASRRGRVWSLAWLLVVPSLLLAVYRLPPDTTLATVERLGLLRACVPPVLPPLVTGDSERPGVDVEILRAVAERMGVRLQLARNAAIGRDFNPRNWRLTRAQCLVVAGGVVDTLTTRSYIDTTTPHLETGWAAVTTDDSVRLAGAVVGFQAGLAGLDRLALSGYLRAAGARVELVPTAQALREGLLGGRFEVAVTDALSARVLADDLGAGARAMWLPAPLERHGIGFGLWKGDLTLKRRLEGLMRELRRDGTLAAILERYELEPMAEECTVCVSPGAPGQ